MCAAMVDRNPDYPSGDYGRSMYDSRPSYDYNQPSYQGQDYGQERYDPPSQYQRAPDPPVQKPVYYTTGSPEQGLPIGNYAQARKVLDNERHRDYNRFMKEKEDQANRRRDEALHRREASPPRQPNQTEMYDHNQVSQQLREERRKEYNDYLKQKEILEHETRRPVTPPGGLAIGGYDVYRNQLKADRVREYRESLLKKEANGTPRAPPTPPVGLNIPTEAERHKIAELRKKQYREELLRQQKEQILNRAQHQLEIPVIDRRQAYSDRPPPNNPPQDRPTSGRWDPETYRQNAFAPVKRVTSPPHQANIGHDDYGQYRRQNEHEVRNKEYNDFLAKKQYMEDEKKQKLVEQRRQAPAPIVKGDYYDSEQYDLRRQALNEQQHRDYQNYLRGHDGQRKRPPTPDSLQGLPLSQRQYDSMRKMQEIQRNKEYNALLAKKGFDKHQPPETNRHPEFGIKSEFQDQFQDPVALLTNRSNHSPERYLSGIDKQARFNLNSHIQIAPQAISSDIGMSHGGNLSSSGWMTETKDEYRSPYGKRQEVPPHNQKQDAERFRKQENARPDNRIGFMSHLGKPVEEMRERLNKERHEDYNKYLQSDNWQKESGGSRSRPPSNKSVPTPSYEEMLEKKRREEASYRRYDDPEYARSGGERRNPNQSSYDAPYRRSNQD